MTRLLGLGSGNNKVVSNFHQLCASASSNTGNLLFNFALEQLIELKQTGLKWNTPAEQLNGYGEPLVVPMANNIGRHMDIEKSGPKLKDIEVPFAIFGLGAQFRLNGDIEQSVNAIPEGTVRWLQDVCSKSTSPNISVRGEFTYKIFERLGLASHVLPLGCPSHFISPNKRLGEALSVKSQQLSSKTLNNGIGITAGNPAIKHLVNLEQFLIKLIDELGGSYVVQNPKDLICVAENWLHELEEAEIENVRDCYFPGMSVQEMSSWMRKHAKTYVSIPQWFSDVSKHDIVTGTRIHGCQIALQAGVPTVCLYLDSRTKELCDTMLVPCLDAHEFQKDPSVDKLIDTLASWDWELYDQNRMKLCRQTLDFIEMNGLTPSSHLKMLVRQ